MAGGYFCKTADWQGGRYLNQVNDPTVGGAAIQTTPAGAPSPTVYQTQPGDRICIDDATALALSLTSVGTLYGGIYMYVLSLTGSTAAPAVGSPAFYRTTDLGTAGAYTVTPDANPTAAIPTFFQGVYINAITRGNYGWIQIAGVASVTYQATVTSTTAGHTVSVGLSQSPPAFDAGVAAYTAVLGANIIGVAIDAPANAGTAKKIGISRFMNRI